MIMRTPFAGLLVLAALAAGCVNRAEVRPHGHPYHYALESPGTLFAGLPPAVQNTIRAQAGGEEITHIARDATGADGTVYRIHFRNAAIFPPLYVAPDGSVLNPDLTIAVGAPRDTIGVAATGPITGGLTLSDLPPDVVRTIQQHAPSSEVEYINRHTHEDRVTYEVGFKSDRYPILHLNADGSVVE